MQFRNHFFEELLGRNGFNHETVEVEDVKIELDGQLLGWKYQNLQLLGGCHQSFFDQVNHALDGTQQ